MVTILYFLLLGAACLFGVLFLWISFLADEIEYEERKRPDTCSAAPSEEPEALSPGLGWNQEASARP